jgi:CTP:molybdopterin cytidylyltransferase MocA
MTRRLKAVGLLPAAGSATRLGGLPKFLLPLIDGSGPPLLAHAKAMSPHVQTVAIVTRPEYAQVVHALPLPENTVVMVALTSTMVETLRVGLNVAHDSIVVGLPDTWFPEIADAYEGVAQKLETGATDWVAAVWQTREWQRGALGSVSLRSGWLIDVADKDPSHEYSWHWGLLGWVAEQDIHLSDEDAHLGLALSRALAAGGRVAAVRNSGTYWDLGTTESLSRYFAQGVQGGETSDHGSTNVGRL